MKKFFTRKRCGASLWFTVVLFLAMAVGGCGYHLSGFSGKMPGGVVALYIPMFENRTQKPDIEGIITSAFATEFATSVDVTEKADVVMNGALTGYSLQSVSYNQNDVNQEYRLTVVVSLKMAKRDGSEVVWQEESISSYGDFAVNTSDLTATREAELAAFRKIARDSARLVKEKMLENF